LDFKEISFILSELEIHVENIKKPSISQVISIYEQLLHLVLQYTTFIHENELLQDSIQFIQFYTKLQSIVKIAGVDMTLKDVLDPNPKRFRIILSAIINFLKFRLEKMDLFDELQQQSEQWVMTRNTQHATLLDLKKVDLVFM
jgi:transcriptional regulator of heat shock response